jgi:hypothetical protein
MAKTKRVQVLMESREFDALERLARKRGSSVADLIRAAVRQNYMDDAERTSRAQAAEEFLALPDVSLPEWEVLRDEIEARHGHGLP